MMGIVYGAVKAPPVGVTTTVGPAEPEKDLDVMVTGPVGANPPPVRVVIVPDPPWLGLAERLGTVMVNPAEAALPNLSVTVITPATGRDAVIGVVAIAGTTNVVFAVPLESAVVVATVMGALPVMSKVTVTGAALLARLAALTETVLPLGPEFCPGDTVTLGMLKSAWLAATGLLLSVAVIVTTPVANVTGTIKLARKPPALLTGAVATVIGWLAPCTSVTATTPVGLKPTVALTTTWSPLAAVADGLLVGVWTNKVPPVVFGRMELR